LLKNSICTETTRTSANHTQTDLLSMSVAAVGIHANSMLLIPDLYSCQCEWSRTVGLAKQNWELWCASLLFLFISLFVRTFLRAELSTYGTLYTLQYVSAP